MRISIAKALFGVGLSQPLKTLIYSPKSLLTQYSLLSAAHILIQSVRPAKYMRRAALFVSVWHPYLHIHYGAGDIFGPNLSAFDVIFEEMPSLEALKNLSAETQALSDLTNAKAYYQSFENKEAALTLEEAVKIHIACITMGYDFLAAKNDNLANQWLNVWQHYLEIHNQHQYQHTAASLQPSDYWVDAPDPIRPFEAAVRQYMDMFQETGALAITLLAVFPFSEKASPEFMSLIERLIPVISPLYRFAQDIFVDPYEPLNPGIYGLAAEYQISLQEARDWLNSGKVNVDEVNAKLRMVWDVYFQEKNLEAQAILSNFNGNPHYRRLKGFTRILVDLAQFVAETWKKPIYPASQG